MTRTPEENAQILKEWKCPEPPGPPLELKYVVAYADWYCRTEEGWWYYRTENVLNKKWGYCPYGPLGM